MAQAQPPERAGISVVVTLPAEIDLANAGRAGADLLAAFAQGVTMVVADMTATTFCDCGGIRALVAADEHAAARGAELRLVVVSASVLRMLAVLDLDRRLAIYPSLQEAVPDGAVLRRSRG